MKSSFCHEATDITVCSVTEATDRDRSAQVADGLALHKMQDVEEVPGSEEVLRPASSG